jgi:hypothetical protein
MLLSASNSDNILYDQSLMHHIDRVEGKDRLAAKWLPGESIMGA